MSVHKSLVSKGSLKRHRNVLTRTERIEELEKEEKWEPEKDSVFALPKVRVAKLKKSHAKKKEAEEGDEEAAAEGTPTAAPAADK